MDGYNLFNLIRYSQFKKVGNDVDYSILIKDREIYLIFKESNSKEDWIHNFNFPTKPYKNQEGKFFVHKGFAETYKSANDIIMKELIDIVDKYLYPVTITGYSFGGAMAQLAAEDFCYRTKVHPKLVTFGSPKILFGEKSKNHFLNSCFSVKQWADTNDIVTMVIPWYKELNVTRLGDKVSIKELCNPQVHHQSYKKEDFYGKQ